MALTAEEILEHVWALPPRERLKLVERVVHEVVEGASADSVADDDAPWADMTDEEYESFIDGIYQRRREQPRRALG
jgi:hypothetical protein